MFCEELLRISHSCCMSSYTAPQRKLTYNTAAHMTPECRFQSGRLFCHHFLQWHWEMHGRNKMTHCFTIQILYSVFVMNKGVGVKTRITIASLLKYTDCFEISRFLLQYIETRVFIYSNIPAWMTNVFPCITQNKPGHNVFTECAEKWKDWIRYFSRIH